MRACDLVLPDRRPEGAGVDALVLSVHPGLDRWELKDLLKETAEKIGGGYNALRHSLGDGLRTRRCGPGGGRSRPEGQRSARV